MKRNSASKEARRPPIAPPQQPQPSLKSFNPTSLYSEEDSGELKYDLIKVPPFHYLHLLDTNTNVVRVVEGPCRYTCLGHERVLIGPEPMVIIPPRHYCVIDNPVVREEGTGKLVLDKHKQAKLRHGEQEIRMEQEPFPLYPGEKLNGPVQPLLVVAENTALRLRALRDFMYKEDHDSEPVAKYAGEEWLFVGPKTYLPYVEVEVVEVIQAVVLKPNQALHLKAHKDCVDRLGNKRRAGEEWLMRRVGIYLAAVDEKIVRVVDAVILTEGKALHLRAKMGFTDIYEKERKTGDEWLVTNEDSEVHIPDVYEEVVAVENIVSLTSRQYFVIVNPVEEGTPQLGKRKLVRGPKNFFLLPGEVPDGPKEVYVLMPEQALQVRATESFDEIVGESKNDRKVIRRRKPGDRWLVTGPREYVPPLEVEVLGTKYARIQLEGLGLYVFDLTPFIAGVILLIVLYWLWLSWRTAGVVAPTGADTGKEL
jgi:major vault protein